MSSVVSSGGCLHENPYSTVQSSAQPSPLRVLPSSHASLPRRIPSPHFETQGPFEQFGSSVQYGVHPSPRSKLPSSHCSMPSRIPLPHGAGTHGEPGASHLNPFSMRHVESQPSPAPPPSAEF